MDIDPIMMTNLIFCVIIMCLGITAYLKMKRKWPLFIGIAYVCFSASHLLTLLDLQETLEGVLFAIRVVGYGLMLFAIYWYGCRKYA